MKSDKYIMIPCKPYVKQFLTQNFGYPINLYSVANPFCYSFRSFLSKPEILPKPGSPPKQGRPRNPNRDCFTDSAQDVPVEFIIKNWDFFEYGWEISDTNIRILNTMFEQSAKLFMRTSVSIDAIMSGCMATSIRRFQTRYDYPEEIWSYDAIKKDLDRSSSRITIDFDSEIYSKIQNILLHNLSKLGTLSKNNQFNHGNTYKRSKQPGRDCTGMDFAGIRNHQDISE